MLSCVNRKKHVAATQEITTQHDALPTPPPPPDVSVTYVGFMELDDSCGHIIRVKMDDKEITFAPLNLDEVYKKPGMRIRFSINHKLDESKTCATHYQITLERITPLRN